MKKRIIFAYALLAALMLVLAVVNLCAGSSEMAAGDLWNTIVTMDRSTTEGIIIWDIRIPRIIAASVLGGGLALAGYLLQAFFANPIAGPYVLGISSGARLMVAVLMVASANWGFGFSSAMMIAAAFAGSLIATFFVILAAGRVRNMAILIVCGVMIGYICSAVTELLISFADDSNIVNLHNWSMGSFSSISWENIETLVPVTCIGLLCALLLSKGLGAYLYGEQYAFSVGMNVKVFRVLLILVSSLLSATVTAFAGPVSFVGIAVPHVIRRTFRTSVPSQMIIGSFMGGAAFCLLCDLLARRMFAPAELSISTVTAVFGAPVVISMLLSRKRG